MSEYIEQIADSWGVLLRRDAIERGVDDNALARLVKGKELVKLRHGAYAVRRIFLAADEVGRHRLLSRAVMQQYGDHVVLSHASAAVAQGAPDFGLDLTDVHLTHLSGGGRNSSRIVHHAGECLVGDLRRQDGHWITVPARTVLDNTALFGAEVGLVQANHFLHQGLAQKDELEAMARIQETWPDTLPHHPVLFLADERIESTGESRSRYLFWTQGLPAPEVQWEVFHPDGALAGRVDFAWPEHGLLLEFDGRQKYHRFRRAGESIEQMVEREKRREDLLRELTGCRMIRLIWKDLDLPAWTAGRIWRSLLRAA
jgi:hypothetical protein